MKTIHQYTIPAAIAALGLLAPAAMAQGNSNKKTIPLLPAGWLNAYPTVVQAGTHPTLNWAISFPSVVKEWVTVSVPATLIAKEDLDCEVRVLGAGVTVSSSGSTNFTFVPTQAQLSYDNGSYNQIFYGTNLQVNPNTVVWSGEIKKNRNLRFGGRYRHNNNWGPYFNSSSGTQNVRTLVSGDTPPTTTPMHLAPTLEDFIKPYLDPDGNVKIGPMDVIVFMELTHTDAQMSNEGYDLQDMVLLVTFKSKFKSNNGHGNNIDGIDSSNPGNAPFINLDTDPNFDDEGGGGGAAPSNP